jgi:anti-anti-sigma regulatory factor
MTAPEGMADLLGLRGGDHVCWVVGDPARYRELAAACLEEGRQIGQKTLVLGPAESPDLEALRAVAVMALDPYVAFLREGPLDPEAMFAAFREQTEISRQEGYSGLRVVADMDWLAPAEPTSGEVIAFELLLDRVVGELGATVVCAYRRESFDEEAIVGVTCVHPHGCGSEAPQFSLTAGGRDCDWRLSGDIDLAVASAFSTAFSATAQDSCVIDITGVKFIDVAGMRTIATAVGATDVRVELRGATPTLVRHWRLGGFDQAAPSVELLPGVELRE